MSERAPTRDRALITAKRLDADEQELTTIDVDVPRSEAGQQAQLIDLVRELYPDAEFRSFGDEAASFLAHKLLVVAVYQRSPESPEAQPPPVDGDSQQQLFAA